MSWWRALFGGSDREGIERDARQLESMASSVKALNNQLATLSKALGTLTAELRIVQRHTDQLVALRTADSDAPVRMQRLESVLDAERVGNHVAGAIARAPLALQPVPYLLVANVFPEDFYTSLVDAVPPAAFFDDGSRPALALPLTFAPVHCIATWTFAIRIVRSVLAPAVLARFRGRLGEQSAGVTASRGHIARTRPGDVIPKLRRRGTHLLTTVVPLLGAAEGGGRLSVSLQRRGDATLTAGSVAETSDRQEIPLAANSALAFASAAGALEYLADATATDTSALYAYEFPFTVPGARDGLDTPAAEVGGE